MSLQIQKPTHNGYLGKRYCKNGCDCYPKFSKYVSATHKFCSICRKAIPINELIDNLRCPCCHQVVRFRSLKNRDRVCKWCGNRFVSKHYAQKYCSTDHQYQLNKKTTALRRTMRFSIKKLAEYSEKLTKTKERLRLLNG